MKLLLLISLIVTFSCLLITAKSLGDGQSETERNDINSEAESQAVDLLRRITRQASKPACKYQKGPWSACDPQTKKRTRTFSLRKGPKSDCEEVKVLSKDCKGKRQKQKNNGKNRDRQRQNKKQEKTRNNNKQT